MNLFNEEDDYEEIDYSKSSNTHNGTHTVEDLDGKQLSFWDWLRYQIYGGWDQEED